MTLRPSPLLARPPQPGPGKPRGGCGLHDVHERAHQPGPAGPACSPPVHHGQPGLHLSAAHGHEEPHRPPPAGPCQDHGVCFFKQKVPGISAGLRPPAHCCLNKPLRSAPSRRKAPPLRGGEVFVSEDMIAASLNEWNPSARVSFPPAAWRAGDPSFLSDHGILFFYSETGSCCQHLSVSGTQRPRKERKKRQDEEEKPIFVPMLFGDCPGQGTHDFY